MLQTSIGINNFRDCKTTFLLNTKFVKIIDLAGSKGNIRITDQEKIRAFPEMFKSGIMTTPKTFVHGQLYNIDFRVSKLI